MRAWDGEAARYEMRHDQVLALAPSKENHETIPMSHEGSVIALSRQLWLWRYRQTKGYELNS